MGKRNIAEVLKSRRKELGFSVDNVCEQLKDFDISISVKTLYNYETGFRKPDAETLLALCEIYEIDDMLYAFGYKKEPTTENDEPEIAEKLFNKLPESIKSDVLRYMRFLAEQEERN